MAIIFQFGLLDRVADQAVQIALMIPNVKVSGASLIQVVATSERARWPAFVSAVRLLEKGPPLALLAVASLRLLPTIIFA